MNAKIRAIDVLIERNAALVETIAAIANNNRFDRSKYIDDEDFVTWAQNIARAALAQAAK